MPEFGGTKWGPSGAFGTSGGVVTWSLTPGGLSGVRDAFRLFQSSDNVTAAPSAKFNVAAALKTAFAAWSKHANITFVQVRDDGAKIGEGYGADIRISFAKIDGAGGALGLAYFPGGAPQSGDILFDSADKGLLNTRSAFMGVAVHEIGHAIGLDHNESASSVMSPQFRGAKKPLADDILGVQTIYGPRGGDASTLQIPGGRSNLTVTDKVNWLRIDGTHDQNRITGGAGRERIDGKEGNDALLGRGGADTLLGGDGNDRLIGGGGADRLVGAAGADRLFGGNGRDALIGGNANDLASGGGGRDMLRGDGGADRLIGGGGNDRLFGGRDNDTLMGGHGADVMNGGGGNDRMFGGGGADRIGAGGGDDLIRGGDGRDVVFGGGGDDVINGDGGADRLTGGGGEDRFVFAPRAGRDTVTDWRDGVDVIDIARLNLSGFGALNISEQKSGVLVQTGKGAAIFLARADIDDIDATDFIF